MARSIRSGAVLVIPVLFLGATLLLGMGARPDNDLKLAVVDISAVFNEHPRVDEMEEKIGGEEERYQAEYKEFLDQIGKLKEEQRELEEGSDLWKEIAERIAIIKEEVKIHRKVAEEELRKMAFEATNELLGEIEEVVVRYCRQNAITLCFKIDTLPLRGSEFSQMELAFKSVVYHEPSIDITREIMDILKKR